MVVGLYSVLVVDNDVSVLRSAVCAGGRTEESKCHYRMNEREMSDTIVGQCDLNIASG